jgi:hypothetical protein
MTIVTYVHRPKRARKRKAQAADMPVIVRARKKAPVAMADERTPNPLAPGAAPLHRSGDPFTLLAARSSAPPAAGTVDAGHQLRLAGEPAAAIVAHLGDDVAQRPHYMDQASCRTFPRISGPR